MKRDMDLVRHILLAIETKPEGKSLNLNDIDVPGHSQAVVGEHVAMLTDAGYINAKVLRTFGNAVLTAVIEGMTWQGHELVDTIRDPEVWQLTKSKLLPAGGTAALGLVMEVAKSYLAKKLGLGDG